MELTITLIIFFILAGITTFSAIKLSGACESFEKYSKLPAILIGALLAIATSLPELATSLTSSLIVNNPSTSIANPIGSNMFNVVILALLNIIFYKKTINYYIKNNNNVFNIIVIIMYLLTFITIIGPSLPLIHLGPINTITLLFFILYLIGIKISTQNDENNQQHIDDPQALKKAIKTFIIFSIIILGSSVLLSMVCDNIIKLTGLGSGFVGAVFLGIATSLPELISSFSLCKHDNYNIAASNIVGSNLFNFIIVAINDVFYKQPLWSEMKVADFPILIYGFIFSAITFFMIAFKTKNKLLNIILPIMIIVLYGSYLVTNA